MYKKRGAMSPLYPHLFAESPQGRNQSTHLLILNYVHCCSIHVFAWLFLAVLVRGIPLFHQAWNEFSSVGAEKARVEKAILPA